MACTPNYPTSLPVDCASSLISILKNGNIAGSVRELAAAAYQLEGYLLSIFPGAPNGIVNGMPPVEAQRALLREAHTLLSEEMAGPADATAGPVGSQLTVFIHTILVPYLKSLLEAVLTHLG